VLVQAESLFNDATSWSCSALRWLPRWLGAIAPGHAIGEFALLAVGDADRSCRVRESRPSGGGPRTRCSSP
jgi:hypothetical protein